MSKAVIDLGFGDSGKGITTDYLCSITQNPLVIRFSGGQQAGHTVSNKFGKHTFSNFGSGTLRGVPTFWSNHCTMDPVGIMNECHTLLKENNIIPKMFISPGCPVTTPYDKLFNRSILSYMDHGTCGVGVGQTWDREENHYHLRYGDLFSNRILNIKLDMIREYYLKGRPFTYSASELDSMLEAFIDACEKAFSENKDEFSIGGMTFSVDSFIYRNYKKKNTYIRNWPEIMTIDGWFEKSEKNKDLLMEEY